MTSHDDPDQYRDERIELAARLAAIKAEQDRLDNEATHLKELLRKTAFAGPDAYDAGPLTVTFATNRRFDPKTADQVIPAVLRPAVFDAIEVVNKDRLKALAPAIYEQCLTDGEWAVRIR